MRFDGKKPIEFTDETVELEQANLEETKYVLKGSAPSSDSSLEDEPTDFGSEEPTDDLDFGSEEGGEEPTDDKPFDDEPFDAGVEADEDTDPDKYIQQLSGKLGQSLRQHSEDTGQPDFDLEKFAVNSVLSATHTSEMDAEDQKDIINKVKSSGKGDDMGSDAEGGENDNLGFDDEEVASEPSSDEELDFGEDDLEEGNSMWEKDPNFSGSKSRFGKDNQWENNLRESKKSRIFVDRKKLIKDLRLMETTEPQIEPQTKPTTKPSVKPAKPLRETDRPFSPKRRIQVQPDPKAESGSDLINDEEQE